MIQRPLKHVVTVEDLANVQPIAIVLASQYGAGIAKALKVVVELPDLFSQYYVYDHDAVLLRTKDVALAVQCYNNV